MQLLLFLRLWAVAELGSAIPEAGGGYLGVREGLDSPNTFINGWMDGWHGVLILLQEEFFVFSPFSNFESTPEGSFF